MPISNRYKLIPVGSVIVNREQRQRQADLSIDDLIPSIKRNGVINPIIITHENLLIAGERRLLASQHLKLPYIPVRFVEDLSPVELKILEHEENAKRKDISWRDHCRAVWEIHELYLQLDPDWTKVQTSEALCLSTGFVVNCCTLAPQLNSPRLKDAPTFNAATNILARHAERAVADAVSDIIAAGEDFDKSFQPAEGRSGDENGQQTNGQASTRPSIIPPDDSILQADFLQWAPSYTGQPFNFVHCDFPYGINVFSGPWSGKNSHTTYKDDPEVYWRLIECLCTNINKIMAPSAHLMFWFSMDHYYETLEAFRSLAPSLAFQKRPLVWCKSDNVGIAPDPQRGPRFIYETALIASREDRPIVKCVANAYSAPTDKSHHTSTKPEPVLRHFFSMFVDDSTRLLDPTSGGGSALRAAESMGAKFTLGLELDPEHVKASRSALKSARVLRAVAK